jgi:hypothetical protein
MSYYYHRGGLSQSSGYGMAHTEGGSGGYASQQFYPVKNGRYMVELKIMSANGSCMNSTVAIGDCMKLVQQILGDVGSDVTLLKLSEAMRLGYNLDMIYDSFPVQGISGDPVEFKEVTTWVQIGGMRPMYAPIGFATTSAGLEENLLGNRGILDAGQIEAVYTHAGVMYRAIRPSINF